MSRHPFALQVEQRAKGRCEYCLMHQQLQGATFHIEHIIPASCGGSDELSNLCLACPSCNLHKSDRTMVTDSESGALVPLFHPRNDRWSDQFEWHDYRLAGRTAIGRATIDALQFNHPRRIQVRQAEEVFGLFPPT